MKKNYNNSIGYVYKITSPTNRIYIGSTNNIARRKSYYKTLKCKNQNKIYNSIKKYGWESHVFEVIWQGKADERLLQEYYYGVLFNVLNSKKGLNLKLPKINDNIKYVSKLISNKCRLRLKQQIIKKGEPLRCRMISSYDLYGNYIETFKTIKDAAIKYNITQAMIGKVLSKKYSRMSNNMQFKYGNSTENIGKIPLWRKINKNVGKYSLNDELIEIMASVSYFVNKYNYPRSSIYKCLNNQMISCSGYKWKFIEQDLLNQ